MLCAPATSCLALTSIPSSPQIQRQKIDFSSLGKSKHFGGGTLSHSCDPTDCSPPGSSVHGALWCPGWVNPGGQLEEPGGGARKGGAPRGPGGGAQGGRCQAARAAPSSASKFARRFGATLWLPEPVTTSAPHHLGPFC